MDAKLQPRGLRLGGSCESLSHVQLFATPRTVARQASLSMEFSRQEYWSRLPFPSPEEPQRWSPASQADSLPFELQGSPEDLEEPD